MVQQYESSSHTVVAHASHVALRRLPVDPGECEHVLVPPVLLLVLLVLPPLEELDDEEEDDEDDDVDEEEELLELDDEELPPATAFSDAAFGVPQPVGPS